MARARRLFLHSAAFGVIDALAEAARVGFFVYLRAANILPAADHVDHGFLAAHELADDFIDEALFDERFNSFRDFHGHLSEPATFAADTHILVD